MGLALVRVGTSIAADRRLRREVWFVAYLTTVGALSAAAFVVARCGAQGHVRYALPTLFLPIGLGAWFLSVERIRRLRMVWIALVVAWAGVSALSHGSCGSSTRRTRLPAPSGCSCGICRREASNTPSRTTGSRYYVSFVTKEQIIVMANDFPRILEYERLVNQHRSEAVLISRKPCGDGKPVVTGLYLCPP